MKNEDELIVVNFTHHEAEHLLKEIRLYSIQNNKSFPILYKLNKTIFEALNEQDHNKESSLS
jgi:hypothetical protein